MTIFTESLQQFINQQGLGSDTTRGSIPLGQEFYLEWIPGSEVNLLIRGSRPGVQDGRRVVINGKPEESSPIEDLDWSISVFRDSGGQAIEPGIGYHLTRDMVSFEVGDASRNWLQQAGLPKYISGIAMLELWQRCLASATEQKLLNRISAVDGAVIPGLVVWPEPSGVRR